MICGVNFFLNFILFSFFYLPLHVIYFFIYLSLFLYLFYLSILFVAILGNFVIVNNWLWKCKHFLLLHLPIILSKVTSKEEQQVYFIKQVKKNVPEPTIFKVYNVKFIRKLH